MKKHVLYQCCHVLNSRTGIALIFFMVVILSALSTMAPDCAVGAEFRIQPGLTLGEEYNDNIFLTPENRSGDFISRVVPSIAVLYKVPLWDWNASAYYEYRYYDRYHDSVKQSNIPNLNLENHTRIKDEFIYLDIKDTYTKTSLDPVRNFTQESAFINQSDSNVISVNPYFILRPTSQMTVTTGYAYAKTWYKDPIANDQVNNTVYTGFQQDLSRRSVMTAGVRITQNKNNIQDYNQDDVYLGFRREYIENSTLSVSVGNTWFHLKDAESISQVTWDANLTHKYSTMTVVYETGLRFIPDPQKVSRREDRYLATLRRDVERTSLVLSGGLLEYRNIVNKHLEDSAYFVTGTMSHALTTRSKIILNLEVDWYKDYLAYTKTERYLTGAHFERLLAKNLTLAVGYSYTNVYTPDVYSNNYFNNRYSAELRMVF